MANQDQDFFEFQMSRRQLFAARDGGLVVVTPSQTEFARFSTHGMDAFNPTNLEGQTSILARCRACHADSGIHSVQSRLRWMKPTPGLGGRGSRNNDPIAWETMVTIRQKEQQREFKLLQSMWRQARD
jgi:hypothetical protein